MCIRFDFGERKCMQGFLMGRLSSAAARPLIEDSLALDVLELARKRIFDPQNRGKEWPVLNNLSDFQIARMTVEATYHHGPSAKIFVRTVESSGMSHTQEIAMCWSACPFGGARPWFQCPSLGHADACSRRVTKLYRAGLAAIFVCRQCADL